MRSRKPSAQAQTMLEASRKGFSFKLLSAQSFLPSSLGSDCSPKAVTDSRKGAGGASWFWPARTHSMEGVGRGTMLDRTAAP